LEIEAAPLQRCSQTPLLDNAMVKRLLFGLSPVRNSLKAASLQCDSPKVPSHRGATHNCLHISLFPLFLSLTQKPLSHSPARGRSPFSGQTPDKQTSSFDIALAWFCRALVFIDPRGTISRCSTGSEPSPLISNLHSVRLFCSLTRAIGLVGATRTARQELLRPGSSPMGSGRGRHPRSPKTRH
jgi:hypothetical protein